MSALTHGEHQLLNLYLILLASSVVLAFTIALIEFLYVNEDLFLAFAAGRDTFRKELWLSRITGLSTREAGCGSIRRLSHYSLYLAHERLGPAGPEH